MSTNALFGVGRGFGVFPSAFRLRSTNRDDVDRARASHGQKFLKLHLRQLKAAPIARHVKESVESELLFTRENLLRRQDPAVGEPTFFLAADEGCDNARRNVAIRIGKLLVNPNVSLSS